MSLAIPVVAQSAARNIWTQTASYHDDNPPRLRQIIPPEGLNYSLNRFQQKPNHEDMICVSHRWPAPISHTSSFFIKSR